jgi:ADP-ribosyl-[dinitrogen reductase] hydrolase
MDQLAHARADRVVGVLLGTAVGDALGLPLEGLSARAIARRFGRVDRYRLLGPWGFVSDDTALTALAAQSLLVSGGDPARAAGAFRRRLALWLLTLPWGVGFATLRAGSLCLLGLTRTGIASAGNGAAMRAAVVGAAFPESEEARRAFGRALAETTHTDRRAVEGALFVAEVAAACIRGLGPSDAFLAGRQVVADAALAAALDGVSCLLDSSADVRAGAERLGTSGFILHTAPFAAFCFLRHADEPRTALSAAVACGGDADSYGAILGAWLGGRHGASGLPQEWVGRLAPGPWSVSRLRALGERLAGLPGPRPRIPWPLVLASHLGLLPVILAHALRRLLP